MKQLLADPLIEPTEPVIAENLGEYAEVYPRLSKLFGDRGYEMIWRYYRDSKAWLCKVARGKKTICWLSIWNEGVKLSFFFTEKNFPHGQKFHNAETPPMWGKMLPVILLVQDDKYFDEIVKLAEAKEQK